MLELTRREIRGVGREMLSDVKGCQRQSVVGHKTDDDGKKKERKEREMKKERNIERKIGRRCGNAKEP